MFHRNSILTRAIAVALAATTTFLITVPKDAQAMLAPAQTSAANPSMAQRSEDYKKVQALLENKVVRQHLHDLGLTDDQINTRLSRLSADQLHQVAMQVHNQNPAGDPSGFLITVLVIGVLAALFIYLIKRI